MFPVILTTQKDQETNTPGMILIWGAGYSIFYTLTNIRWSIYMHIYMFLNTNIHINMILNDYIHTYINIYMHRHHMLHITYKKILEKLSCIKGKVPFGVKNQLRQI